ncbi:MAG: hypothetical protein HY791_34490 [Deltaproteobacteria bacterium]|nr:hypothetical protein [Deltaproteobacteria bacterium]
MRATEPGRRPSFFVVGLVALSEACVPTSLAPLAPDPTRLFSVVVAPESREATIVPSGGGWGVALRDESELLVFDISTADLKTPAGLAPDVPSARFADAPAPQGGCGRCLAPVIARGPQIIHAGDSCLTPPFADVFRVEGDGLVAQPTDSFVASVRREVLLDWEGPCAFQVAPDVAQSLDFAVVSPEQDAVPATAGAMNSAGDLGLFSLGLAVRIGADGSRREAGAPPFVSEVGFVVALANGDFLVESEDTQPRIHRFDEHMTASEVTVNAPIEIDVNHLVRLRSDVDAFLAGAHDVEAGPSSGVLLRCELRDRTLECARLLDRRIPFAGDFASIHVMDDGTMLGFGDGYFVTVSPDGERWSWRDPSFPPDVELARLEAQLTSTGDQIVLCLSGQRRGVARFFSTTVDSTAWTPLGEWPGICEGVVSVPGSPQLRWVQVAPGQAVEVDFARMQLALRDRLWAELGLDRPFESIFEGPGALFTMDEFGRASVGQPSALRLVYGSASVEPGTIGAIVEERPDRFVGFSTVDGKAFQVSYDRSAREVSWASQLGFGAHDLVSCAARDSADGTMLVGGGDEVTGRAILRRVDAGGVATAIEIPAGPLVAITEELPGSFVVADEEWGLWRVRSGRAESIEIQWDDPRTAEIETKPLFDRGHPCKSRPTLSTPLENLSWRALGAAGAVVWAVGCRGVVARVVGEVAERLSPRSIFADGIQDPDLTALDVKAPDFVELAARGDEEPFHASGLLWRLEPDAQLVGLVGRQLVLERRPQGHDLGPPLGLSHGVMVFDHTVRTTVPPFRWFEFAGGLSAAAIGEGVVLASDRVVLDSR